MKKIGFCKECNLEFEYLVNNMNDLNNVMCPKCNKNVDSRYRKTVLSTKLDKTVGKITNNIFNFWYYFYFIFSVVAIISFYLKIKNVFVIFAVISLIVYFIELLLGFTRNIFGLVGFIISSVIGIFIVKDAFVGVLIGSSYLFFISGVIRIIYDLIINFLFNKYG